MFARSFFETFWIKIVYRNQNPDGLRIGFLICSRYRFGHGLSLDKLTDIKCRVTAELDGAAFRVRTSDLLCDYTVVKDNIFTGSHSLIQFGQFLKAGH